MIVLFDPDPAMLLITVPGASVKSRLLPEMVPALMMSIPARGTIPLTTPNRFKLPEPRFAVSQYPPFNVDANVALPFAVVLRVTLFVSITGLLNCWSPAVVIFAPRLVVPPVVIVRLPVD